VRTPAFIFWQVAVAAALYLVFRYVHNDYIFFAGYTVLQFIVLSTAWNILGGYCGYVNFGSAGFFALGAYSSVCLYTIGQSLEELFPESLVAPMQLIFPLPLPVLIIVAGIVAGLVGLGTGYLTLRLRGVFFCYRHACARGRVADLHRELVFRRRFARRICHSAERNSVLWALHPVFVCSYVGTGHYFADLRPVD
jgi:hypothetical protein